MQEIIDLRSDTVTVPTNEMRKAMAAAEVGDDVFGEDPTINALQALSAEMTGKEDSIFLPTGTAGNLLAMYVGCPRATEVLMHEEAHTFSHEISGAAALVGCKPVPVAGDRGILKEAELLKKYRSGSSYYEEKASSIIIENTHNFCGGAVWSADELAEVAAFAKARKLYLHMDGARVFNASVKTRASVQEICKGVDSVTFCLSKGLGAPAGSMLCGDRAFIDEVRRARKMFGAGMRQVGILAAAGIYALKNNIDKLAVDHQNAQTLAQACAKSSWAASVQEPETNLLFIETRKPAQEAAKLLADRGVRCFATGPNQIRFVTHLSLSQDAIAKAVRIIGEI